MTISRRTLLKGIGAAPAAVSLFSIPRYAHAAEITLRYGNNLPLSHPLNIRAKEAADRIAKETNGRVEVLVRLANEQGQELSPQELVRAAERYRLMGLVDRWVLQTTFTALGRGAIALPAGYAAFVHPRSGLGHRLGVSIVNTPGTIDAGYRGEIKVILVNHDLREAAVFKRGDRIAQLVVQRVERAAFHEVAILPGSDRGAGGYGSTGGFAAQTESPPAEVTR